MSVLPDVLWEPMVRAALAEDLGLAGDVTAALLPAGAQLRARMVARRPGVVAGLAPARLAFTLVDPRIEIALRKADGDRVAAGEAALEAVGPAGPMLAAERVALNFLTHLSGVATLTRAFVDAVAGTRARIAGTRKTLPGLRAAQKAAIIAGGGWPHRYGLFDAVLIKDNHIAAAGGVAQALTAARAAAGHLTPIEVEVDRLDQLAEALPFAPNVVLLDNFDADALRQAVALAKGAVILEASGGITLANVLEVASTGVDVISVGALTHSAPALDIGFDVVA